MQVVIDAVDRKRPITMEALIIDEGAEGLPIVEYRHSGVANEDALPTLLCFAGGGASGAMFARLAEECASRGIRLVSFDMPGHTPEKLLQAATPPRSLISGANSAARLAASKTMISRWLPKSTRLQVLSHSAGVVDIARIIPAHGADIARFVITGAGIPGLAAMLTAVKGAAADKSIQRLSVPSIITTRQIPTGDLTLAYGAESDRVISDATLRRYESTEHIGVPLALLRARTVERQDWRGRTVVLIGSRGDVISPPARLRDAEKRLRARGATVRTEILPWNLPHAFLAFGAAAQRVAEIAGQPS